jgi:hypothetical protein
MLDVVPNLVEIMIIEFQQSQFNNNEHRKDPRLLPGQTGRHRRPALQ